jgi:hypothetical protein
MYKNLKTVERKISEYEQYIKEENPLLIRTIKGYKNELPKLYRLREKLMRDSLGVEHRSHKPDSAGSNPAPASINLEEVIKCLMK